MAKTIKRVVVELHFSDNKPEKPYIKDWWLKARVATAMASYIPEMNKLINDVDVEAREVTLLPDEICISTATVLGLKDDE